MAKNGVRGIVIDVDVDDLEIPYKVKFDDGQELWLHYDGDPHCCSDHDGYALVDDASAMTLTRLSKVFDEWE